MLRLLCLASCWALVVGARKRRTASDLLTGDLITVWDALQAALAAASAQDEAVGNVARLAAEAVFNESRPRLDGAPSFAQLDQQQTSASGNEDICKIIRIFGGSPAMALNQIKTKAGCDGASRGGGNAHADAHADADAHAHAGIPPPPPINHLNLPPPPLAPPMPPPLPTRKQAPAGLGAINPADLLAARNKQNKLPEANAEPDVKKDIGAKSAFGGIDFAAALKGVQLRKAAPAPSKPAKKSAGGFGLDLAALQGVKLRKATRKATNRRTTRRTSDASKAASGKVSAWRVKRRKATRIPAACQPDVAPEFYGLATLFKCFRDLENGLVMPLPDGKSLSKEKMNLDEAVSDQDFGKLFKKTRAKFDATAPAFKGFLRKDAWNILSKYKA